jgi:hypothetical protein
VPSCANCRIAGTCILPQKAEGRACGFHNLNLNKIITKAKPAGVKIAYGSVPTPPTPSPQPGSPARDTTKRR